MPKQKKAEAISPEQSLLDLLTLTKKVEFGITYWFDHNLAFHHPFGPAVYSDTGSEEWFHRGKLHRIGGPAVTFRKGNLLTESWWKDGNRVKEQVTDMFTNKVISRSPAKKRAK